MNRRHIQLQVIAGDAKAVLFRVWKCSHTGEEFTDKGCVFNASNGVGLVYADSELAWNERSYSLHLSEDCKGSCGYVRRNEPISVSPEDFAKICKAVEEYNNTRWNDKEGQPFWYFDSFFNLSYSKGFWYFDSFFNLSYSKGMHPLVEDTFRSTGNCFYTKEEAEAAIERMRDQLCKMDEERSAK